MDRINTENLNENDSLTGILPTPRFTHEAEERALRVEKLPKTRRTLRDIVRRTVTSVWFLGIALITTVVLGAIGGAVAGLRDNQYQTESSPLAGTVTGEAKADMAGPSGTLVTAASEQQIETKAPVPRREPTTTSRRPVSWEKTQQADVSQGQPVARKVGVIGDSSFYWYRKRRVSGTDN
jgi:hypothetical protein